MTIDHIEIRTRGYQLVMDQFIGGFTADFRYDREYEFIAPTWPEPRVMKLSAQSPFFNVNGLMFRAAPVDTHPKGGDGTAPFMGSAVAEGEAPNVWELYR